MQHVIVVGDAEADDRKDDWREFDPQWHFRFGAMMSGDCAQRGAPETASIDANKSMIERCARKQCAGREDRQRDQHNQRRFMHVRELHWTMMAVIVAGIRFVM